VGWFKRFLDDVRAVPPPAKPAERSRSWDAWGNPVDGLITNHLECHLPPELPFQGHTLKRGPITAVGQQYSVIYSSDAFFNCNPAAGALAHESLIGGMIFYRVRPERLLEALQEQLRFMYKQLEEHIQLEAFLGCSIRPPGDH